MTNPLWKMPLLRTITRRLQEGDFNQSTFVVRLICGLVDLWADWMDPIQRLKLFILLHKIHYSYSRFPQTVTNSKSTPTSLNWSHVMITLKILVCWHPCFNNRLLYVVKYVRVLGGGRWRGGRNLATLSGHNGQ